MRAEDEHPDRGGETREHNLQLVGPPKSTAEGTETLVIPRCNDNEVDFVNKLVKLVQVVKRGESLATITNYQGVDANDKRHLLAVVRNSMTAKQYGALEKWDFGRGEQPPFSDPPTDWSEPRYQRKLPSTIYGSTDTLAQYVERVSVLGRYVYPQYPGSFRLENVQWLVENGMSRASILPLVDAIIIYREVMSKYPALADATGERTAELKTLNRVREVAENKVGTLRTWIDIIEEGTKTIDKRWNECLEEMKGSKEK